MELINRKIHKCSVRLAFDKHKLIGLVLSNKIIGLVLIAAPVSSNILVLFVLEQACISHWNDMHPTMLYLL